jgi:hypothetical protein
MRKLLATLGAAMTLVATASRPGEAHKPILSPFMFHEDVQPVLQARCAACHSPGGVAPMSLLTYEETVPWGESIRLELIAGHMPPWSVENAADFRDAAGLTARELNVLLTWAAGGTPRGQPPVTTSAGTPPLPGWRLGPPDLVLEPAHDFTLAADSSSETARFTLPAGTTQTRRIRAVDLRPGNPSIVRRATLEIDAAAPEAASGLPEQRLLALWQPGSPATEVHEATGFQLPAGATLTLGVEYRRNWRHERAPLTDRPRVGLYFADDGAAVMRAFTLAPDGHERAGAGGELLFIDTVPRDLGAIAIYPDPSLAGVQVTVVAVPGDGARLVLFDSRLRAGWARRYVYREPVPLRAGTRLEVTARSEPAALLPPGLTRPAPSPLRDVRLTLDVVERR